MKSNREQTFTKPLINKKEKLKQNITPLLLSPSSHSTESRRPSPFMFEMRRLGIKLLILIIRIPSRVMRRLLDSLLLPHQLLLLFSTTLLVLLVRPLDISSVLTLVPFLLCPSLFLALGLRLFLGFLPLVFHLRLDEGQVLVFDLFW